MNIFNFIETSYDCFNNILNLLNHFDKFLLIMTCKYFTKNIFIKKINYNKSIKYGVFYFELINVWYCKLNYYDCLKYCRTVDSITYIEKLIANSAKIKKISFIAKGTPELIQYYKAKNYNIIENFKTINYFIKKNNYYDFVKYCCFCVIFNTNLENVNMLTYVLDVLDSDYLSCYNALVKYVHTYHKLENHIILKDTRFIPVFINFSILHKKLDIIKDSMLVSIFKKYIKKKLK